MLSFIRKRAVASLISLIGLVVMVFFLSRLTGDPAALALLGTPFDPFACFAMWMFIGTRPASASGQQGQRAGSATLGT